MATSAYRPNVIKDLAVLLLNYDKDPLDITRILVEFNVFEDLFDGVLKASIVLEDTIGMITDLPLVGDEKLVIAFKVSDDDEEPIEYVFDVYKLEDRTILEERTHLYNLHAVSPGYTESQFVRVNKAFKNKLVSDVAQEVYDDYFLPTNAQASGEIGTIDIEPSENKISITGSRSTPLEFMLHLATEARSAEYPDSPFYVFYESTDGYHFKSINKLMREEPKESFYWADANDSPVSNNRGEVKGYQVISSLRFNQQFDRVRNLNMGLYDTTYHYIDPHKKMFATRQFNYLNNFDLLTTYDDDASFPVIPQKSRIKDGKGDAHIRYNLADLNIDHQDQSFGGRLTPSNDPHKYETKHRHFYAAESMALLHSLNQYVLEVSIPGNIDIRIGDVINLYVPENSDLVESRRLYQRLFGQENPKFFVTALSHHYKTLDDTYVTFMEVSKVFLGEEPVAQKKAGDEATEGSEGAEQNEPKTEAPAKTEKGGLLTSTSDVVWGEVSIGEGSGAGTPDSISSEQTDEEAAAEVEKLREFNEETGGGASKAKLTDKERAYAVEKGYISDSSSTTTSTTSTGPQ